MIEKQRAGFTHGCDKMTCRCGCKFCFLCGTIAGPGGEARCQCVGDHHGYLPHDEVLRNYAGDAFGAFGNAGVQGLGGFFGQAVGEAMRAASSGQQGFAAGGGAVPLLPELGAVFGQAMRQAGGGDAGHATGQGFGGIFGQAIRAQSNR